MRTNLFLSRLLPTLIVCMALLMPIGSLSADNSPLCFTARNGSVDVVFRILNVTHTIQYSTNGTSWSTYTSNSNVTINANQSIYFRAATNQTTATAFAFPIDPSCSHFNFTSSNGGTVEGSGNIMSLYGPDCPNLPLQEAAFRYMFYGCTSLTTAPELPATTLAVQCYSAMFYGCTSLTTAPELPATTLANYCYSAMFDGCTSLTTAPELPATTLAKSCYYGMFEDCTSLTTAPELPATTLAKSCYREMFEGCIALKTAPELPATTLAERCYDGMFDGCSSLTTAPELPATTLADSCYEAMFSGCTSLVVNTEGPGKEWIIPATDTASYSVTDMFTGTGGTMNGTPEVNTTYYIASAPSAVDEVTLPDMTVVSEYGGIIVKGAEGYDVMVCDAGGKVIGIRKNAGDYESIKVPVEGIYFVKIDDVRCEKVVVK